MKMMRSTRQTSTRGVTLMSLWSLSRLLTPPIDMVWSSSAPSLGSPDADLDAGPAPLDEVVEKGRSRVGHLDLEALDLVHEDVEEPHRRDRDEEPQGRRDQGLGDACRNGRDAARAGQRHAAEGVDDADDRPEEADEGGGRPDRGEPREPLLHIRRRDERLPLDRPFGGFDRIVPRNVRGAGRQVVREFVEPGRYDARQMAVLELLGGIDRLLQLVLLQVTRDERREGERLLLRLVVIDEPLDRHRQGVDGHQDQQDAHTLGERRHRVPEIDRVKTHEALLILILMPGCPGYPPPQSKSSAS